MLTNNMIANNIELIDNVKADMSAPVKLLLSVDDTENQTSGQPDQPDQSTRNRPVLMCNQNVRSVSSTRHKTGDLFGTSRTCSVKEWLKTDLKEDTINGAKGDIKNDKSEKCDLKPSS